MMKAAFTAWLGLAGWTVSANAAGLITYQLVNTSNASAPAVTEVVASIIPPGSIAPTSPDVSPLSILPGSSGFDANNLKVLLGDGTSPTGDPLQALALDFGSGGFASGGVLNFSLSIDGNFKGLTPQLILPPGTSGLRLSPYTPPPTNPTGGPGGGPIAGGTTNGGTTQVPEPLSVVLWSAVAGAALMRSRVFRRAKQAL
jgi:hypothetical protein